MKRILHIFIIAGLLGNLLAGCQKDPSTEQRRVVLDICPTLDATPATKNTVIPNTTDGIGNFYMPGGTSFGLFICKHHTGSYTDGSNPYTEYSTRYNNICAKGGNNSWSYNYYGYRDFSTLYLVPKDESPRDGITDYYCDIFAYAPYQNGITRLEAIPFSIPGQTDVMYAQQNGISNLNIDPDYTVDPHIPGVNYPDATGHLEVPLTFKHALSLLEFDIQLKNDKYNHPWGPFGSEYSDNTIEHVLQSITIDKVYAPGHLYTSGKMNAMTSGTLYDLTEASTVTVTSFGINGGSGLITVSPGIIAKAYMMLVPTTFDGASDEDCLFRFSFHFSGQDFPITFSLKKKHLKHSDSTYGLQSNCKYIFHFTIDNYIHLEDVEMDTWQSVDVPFQKEL